MRDFIKPSIKAAVVLVGLYCNVLCSSSTRAGSTEYFVERQFNAAAGTTTLVNFDNLTAGNGRMTGSEYVNLGLTVVQRDGFPITVVRFGGGDTTFITLENDPESINSSPNAISSSAVNGIPRGFDDSRTDNFDFIFTTPARAAGLYVGNLGPGPTTVQFLRPDDSVLAEEVLDRSHTGLIGSGFNNRIFYGLTTDEAIGRIRTIEPAFDGDSVLYDDIRFGVAAVPEPASIVLLSAGILGMLGYGWHRRGGELRLPVNSWLRRTSGE